MPPQTRMTSVKESRILRSKKVRFVESSVRISLTRCDNTNGLSRSNNSPSPKKNIVKVDAGKSSTKSLNSPTKPKDKQKLQPSPTKKIQSPKSPVKPVEIKKPVAVKNDIRKPILEASFPTKTITKDKQSSPTKKAAPPEIVKHKQSPIKTTTNKDISISKSEIRIKKPLLKKPLSKEKRLKKQMKLGRIFIKPTFPIKTILKREIHSGDKEENQGQLVSTTDNTRTRELNNNSIVNVKRTTIVPKIVLNKIDQKDVKAVRESTRKILRHL